jgi:hypothetical protein
LLNAGLVEEQNKQNKALKPAKFNIKYSQVCPSPVDIGSNLSYTIVTQKI